MELSMKLSEALEVVKKSIEMGLDSNALAIISSIIEQQKKIEETQE